MKTRLRGILVAAVLLRVLLAAAALVVARSPAGFAIFAAGDTSKYVRLASSIAVHGRFEDEGLPEVFRTPGYPLLLTPGILAGDVYVFAVLMQVLVVVATVALVYETARLLYDEERIAWWCAALCAFEPTLLAWSVRVTPDAPLAMLVALAAYALIRGVRQQKTMWFAGAAAALAASAYVKPIGYFLPAGVMALLVAWGAQERRWRPLFDAAVFAAVAIALVAAWQLRNRAAIGYGGFSSQIEHQMLVSGPGAAQAARSGRSFIDVADELHDQLPRVGAPPVSISDAAKAISGLSLAGLARTLFNPGASAYFELFGASTDWDVIFRERERRPLPATLSWMRTTRPALFWANAALAVLLLPFLLLPAIGVCVERRARQLPPLLLWALALELLVLASGPYAQSRLRVPAMPLLAILAGYGIAFASARRRTLSLERASDLS